MTTHRNITTSPTRHFPSLRALVAARLVAIVNLVVVVLITPTRSGTIA